MAALLAALLLTGCSGGKKFAPPRVERTRLLQLSAIQTDPDGQTTVRAFVQPVANRADEWYRFELYQYLPRSANPRGKRIRLWPDVNPGKTVAENPLWKPHLRAFEIALPLENGLPKSTYLLELTVLKANTIQHSQLLKITFKSAPQP